MLDHIGVPVWEFERSKRFSTPKPSVRLATSLSCTAPSALAAGFGQRGKPEFWIAQGEVGQAFHIAFAAFALAFAFAAERATVDAFHEAAIAAGGRDNGGPGLGPEYHPSYYGAFVLDPDVNNIEAVCHRPAEDG